MSINALTASSLSGATGAGKNKNTAEEVKEASDRFLKLLVTQMQNQDPLNPLDNAQVTSQMAQINTVTGIDKLNNTVAGLGSNLTQMQMLQGANLVGRNVLLEGNALAVNPETGKAGAGYELSSAASKVRIEITNASGTVIDTMSRNNQSAGRQGFEWTPPPGMSAEGLRFKVSASNGSAPVPSTPLMSANVQAINTTNGTLTLELSNGSSASYSQVKAIS